MDMLEEQFRRRCEVAAVGLVVRGVQKASWPVCRLGQARSFHERCEARRAVEPVRDVTRR